jgi:hypothetical protein
MQVSSGYSIEAQVTGAEVTGGLQFEIPRQKFCSRSGLLLVGTRMAGRRKRSHMM